MVWQSIGSIKSSSRALVFNGERGDNNTLDSVLCIGMKSILLNFNYFISSGYHIRKQLIRHNNCNKRIFVYVEENHQLTATTYIYVL